jgi:cytochrome o ubiquinol oxidase subunit 2
VVGLGIVLWDYTHTLDPYRQLVSTQPALEIQAVGLDWKWLFIYPGNQVAAVNQMVIPVGRPVHISLTSGTVMQSMLIPQLAGQIYAMAGMTTQLNLAASVAGVYRGENTQFNGTGFQSQKFNVVALAPADYTRWQNNVKASARPFDGKALDDMFQRSIMPQPIFFSSVPANLYQQIQRRSQEPRS